MPLDDRLRQGLPGLVSGVEPDPDDALDRVLAAGRRRRMVRRIAAGAAAAAVVTAGAIAVPRVIGSFAERPTGFGRDPGQGRVEPDPDQGYVVFDVMGTHSHETDYRNDRPIDIRAEGPGIRCTDWFGFYPTYLPAGLVDDQVLGQGPPTGGPLLGRPVVAPPLEKGQVALSWTDGERFIEIRRPGMLFAELAQEEGAPTVTVLGQETADYGPLAPNYEQGPAGEDFMIQFRYPADSQPAEDPSTDCAFFSVTEYGLDQEELIRFAEGLRAAPAHG